jgi:tRNA U34 2-thiouridine synthase MnmA/TrmU
MEKKCQDCQQICKKLAENEQPVHYHYAHLTPAEVIEICSQEISDHAGVCLNTEDSAVSFGNQLAVMMEPVSNVKSDSLSEIIFIIQAEIEESAQTNMWIRYGTPAALCADTATATVTELTILIQKLLHRLNSAERLAHDKFHL